MESQNTTHSLSEEASFFNCANALGSLRCSKCTNFETYKLVDLKQHAKAGHTLTESKEDLYECQGCSLHTHSKYIILRHQLLDLCLRNGKVKSEEEIPEGNGDDIKRCLDKKPSKSRVKKLLNKMNKCFKDKLVKCEHCLHTTKYVHHLKRHILRKHTNLDEIRWFECEHCSYKSKIKSRLIEHMDCHANKTQFKCDHCQFESKFKRSLKAHIRRQHTNPDKIQWFKCDHCAFKTKTKSNMKHHIKCKHTDPDQLEWFQCGNCAYKSKTRETLKQHVAWKHADPGNKQWFQCEHCSYKSKTKSNLKQHITCKHTAPEHIHWFQCEHCSYKGKIKYDLKKHMECIHFKKETFK